MYFHCFLLMPHLFSSLFREISCKSCPYPPSSLSSLKPAPIRLGFCRSQKSLCSDHRDSRVSTPSGQFSLPAGAIPLAQHAPRTPLTPSPSGFSSYFLDQFLLSLLRQLLSFSNSECWALPGSSTLLFSICTHSREDLNQPHDFKPYVYTPTTPKFRLHPVSLSYIPYSRNQPRAHYV